MSEGWKYLAVIALGVVALAFVWWLDSFRED